MTDAPEITQAPAALPEKPSPTLATLSDLECANITLIVPLHDEKEVAVPIRMVSQYRRMQINAMVAEPTPPTVDGNRAADGTINWVKNFSDPNYLMAATEANFKRNSMVMAEMIQLALPGDTLDEKGQYIREKFDPLVTQQIWNWYVNQFEKAKARIITRAETFLG